MKALTKKRLSRKGKALQRSASSWSGMFMILGLLQRAETHDVSTPISSFAAVDLYSMKYGKI